MFLRNLEKSFCTKVKLLKPRSTMDQSAFWGLYIEIQDYMPNFRYFRTCALLHHHSHCIPSNEIERKRWKSSQCILDSKEGLRGKKVGFEIKERIVVGVSRASEAVGCPSRLQPPPPRLPLLTFPWAASYYSVYLADH